MLLFAKVISKTSALTAVVITQTTTTVMEFQNWTRISFSFPEEVSENHFLIYPLSLPIRLRKAKAIDHPYLSSIELF